MCIFNRKWRTLKNPAIVRLYKWVVHISQENESKNYSTCFLYSGEDYSLLKTVIYVFFLNGSILNTCFLCGLSTSNEYNSSLCSLLLLTQVAPWQTSCLQSILCVQCYLYYLCKLLIHSGWHRSSEKPCFAPIRANLGGSKYNEIVLSNIWKFVKFYIESMMLLKRLQNVPCP